MLLHLLRHLPRPDIRRRRRRRPHLHRLRPRPAGVPPGLVPVHEDERYREYRRSLPGRQHDGEGGGEEPEQQDGVAFPGEQRADYGGEWGPESGVDEGGGV